MLNMTGMEKQTAGSVIRDTRELGVKHVSLVLIILQSSRTDIEFVMCQKPTIVSIRYLIVQRKETVVLRPLWEIKIYTSIKNNIFNIGEWDILKCQDTHAKENYPPINLIWSCTYAQIQLCVDLSTRFKDYCIIFCSYQRFVLQSACPLL